MDALSVAVAVAVVMSRGVGERTRVESKWIEDLFEEFFGAAEFLGGWCVVREARFLQGRSVLGVLRFEESSASMEVRVRGTGQRIAARAFVAPGGVGFGRIVGTREVGAPAANGVTD